MTTLKEIAFRCYACSHDDGETVGNISEYDLIDWADEFEIDEDGDLEETGEEMLEINEVECYVWHPTMSNEELVKEIKKIVGAK